MWAACTASKSSQLPPDAVSGIVVDDHGPVAGATVSVQASDLAVTTDADGRFRLTGLRPGVPVVLTAFAPGYYIAGGDECLPGTADVELALAAHADQDNPDYQWLSAFSAAGDDGNCQNCHGGPTDPVPRLPFDEWVRDAHSSSAQNPRFITMYTGTDVDGNRSPQTRYGYSRDYGRFALRPDPNQAYYGPGYKLDFPDNAGNCAACHAPAASIDDPYGVDPTSVAGVGTEGATCDFCHKVWDVLLDPARDLPLTDMPGVLSFEFLRPYEDHQFFAGPLYDVAPGEDTYSRVQNESEFCAACHFGAFWDTVVYNSFGEWLESPYSDSTSPAAQTCQDCHMPSGQNDHFALFDKGGHLRDPATIFSHLMPGAADEELLQKAVTMTATARAEENAIIVQVDITNDGAGHHVPTDSPLRHLILLVEAADADGNTLPQVTGPTVPEWGGVGSPDEGCYAGLPGKAFAKVLEELWTQVSPTGAYWNPTRVVSDNRIPALAADISTYTFAAPDAGATTVTVRLLFRRAFIVLMDQKGWDVPDIVIDRQVMRVP